ncbi:hypothetical protein [Streptomyces sp. NBRC 110028]|uniref:hypothetical protein n=1 Tax=Streptomyces sp. NBRC 110028 TaxID=1621260 RepID=UPI0006E1983E|nr:hypothetical protein [Streptomyces sp. NBRC 110028]
MEIELLPHVGVASFRIGMSFDEAMALAREWGSVELSSPDERPPGKFVVVHEESELDFALIFSEGDNLGEIEVRRFQNEGADVRVMLDGLDVFRTSHEELQRQLGERGHQVEENDMGFDAVPDLDIILANDSSYEYPTDEDGYPLYYDYVLDRITS